MAWCMKKKIFMALLMLLAFTLDVTAQPPLQVVGDGDNGKGIAMIHPWQGRRVGYIGDSITDPNNNKGKIKKYWEFLQEWLNITPYVYGRSGRQWNDVPRQARMLKEEHGDEVDAIVVFIGTNDFNGSVPIGEWFVETTEQVMAAKGQPQKLETRRHRTFVMSDSTYKGRINIGIDTLKRLFPDRQIVLLTPLHRAFAKFSDINVQPDENYQNGCGEYIDAYVQAVKDAGNLWGVPVIDLNAVSGLNPMIEGQLPYFNEPGYDCLHPSTKGQERIACALVYQLLALPCTF